jgi:hypothetical protein
LLLQGALSHLLLLQGALSHLLLLLLLLRGGGSLL